MVSQAQPLQSRAEVILGQAIGPEFSYYLDSLRQPDSTVLIKLGGAIVDTQLEAVSDAVQTLVELEIYPAIVHGAGPQINRNLAAQGIPDKKIDGKRVTDAETLAVVAETLGTVNGTIIESLGSRGVSSQPFTNGIFTADYLDKETYGYVGDIPVVNVQPITDGLAHKSVPVISCLGSDVEGRWLNINADTASAALAGRLLAHKFVTLSDVGGVMDQKGVIIPVLNIRSGAIDKLIADGTISDGMIPKIQEITASVEELSDDSSAVITLPENLIKELFTHAGEGTLIRKGDEIVHYSSIRAVNQHMIRQLIESAFGGKLLKDYFTRLPESAEVFTTAQVYNGVAIVVPEASREDKQLPAYLDKLVVRPEFRGYGTGKELLDTVRSHYPNGLFWRARTSNVELIDWYSRIASSRSAANGWTVFTVGVSETLQDDCIQKAINIEPSIIY